MGITMHQRVVHPSGAQCHVSDIRNGGSTIYLTFPDGSVRLAFRSDVEAWLRNAPPDEHAAQRAYCERYGIAWVEPKERT